MPSSGDTLSLTNLAVATGNSAADNISLNGINGSAGTEIAMSDFSVGSVDSISGYTYAVEGTNETYTVLFSDEGSNFGTVKSVGSNFTWGISPAFNSDGDSSGFISLESSADYTNQITVGTMNPQFSGTQTSLMSNFSHTISSTFADGFNHHATNYNTELTKTVFSVDSYDGNSTSLCISVDTPVTLKDGTTIEAGDITEGLELQGYSFDGLGEVSDASFYDWSSNSMGEESQDVEVVNVVFSFADSYYNINDGEIKATQDHPMLVKDGESGLFKFKKLGHVTTNDKLIKKVDGNLIESDITSIDTVDETLEIVTIDVETYDTYLINGYVTHNKGGDSHSDLSAPSVPTNLAYTEVDTENHNITWDAVSGASAYRLQVDNNSDFSSPIIDADEYNGTTYNVVTALGSGTFYARVRAIDHGLNGNYTSTLTITR